MPSPVMRPSSGLAGLKNAMKGNKELLPAIGAIGLAPFLLDAADRTERSAAYSTSAWNFAASARGGCAHPISL